VLGLFGGELQEGPDARFVAHQERPYVIEDERHDEFLDDAEEVQVVVSANLIEQQALAVRQAVQLANARQVRGEEGLVKSRRLSPPITSSSRQLTRSEACNAAAYV
jgi:hypothetical protein